MADNNLSQFAQLQRDNPSGFVEGGQFYKSQSAYDQGNALNQSGQSAPLNFDSVLKRATQMAQEAVKPAVSSLTASIPETQARFSQERTRLEGQAAPLTARYESLLNDIKGRQQTSTEQQTLATANELGRRGVSTTSGLGEQTITSANAPITRDYAGLIEQTGLSREADLSALQGQITGLTGQSTDAVRAIQNAIAQLQSGAATGAVPTALSLLGQQQSANQFGQQLSQQQQQYDSTAAQGKAAQELQSKIFNLINLPESQANVQNIQSQISNRNATPPTNGLDVNSFLQQFGIGQPQQTTKPSLSSFFN